MNVYDFDNLWNEPTSRLSITIESLGIGFWIFLLGIIILSKKLGKKKILLAIIASLLLSLPGIYTSYLLKTGRKVFLSGDYLKSHRMYKNAMRINQAIGNKSLSEFELYYLWLGESLFHLGIKDAPEIHFFKGKNLELRDSFIKSKEMYQNSMDLPPAKFAYARVSASEAVNDLNKNGIGSAMEKLKEGNKFNGNQIEGLFYMTYISYLVRNHDSTLYYSSLLFDICREKIVISDGYNILGDLNHNIEEFTASRTAYRKSIRNFDRVKKGNYHAWKGIAGW